MVGAKFDIKDANDIYIFYGSDFLKIDDIQEDRDGNYWIWFGDFSKVMSDADQFFIPNPEVYGEAA